MSKPKQAVILVHGLYMKPWTWVSYQRFLKRKGFKVYTFGYKTVHQHIDLTLMKLIALVNSRPEETVHLVAHSMGGIVSMLAMPKFKKQGKMVILGSPVNGSQVAKKIHQKGWHRKLLKFATKPLIDGVDHAIKNRPIMMIAGTSPYGLGRIIEPRLGPSDGTVGLRETMADWIDQHHEIHCSHFALLYNKKAKALTAEFLQS